MNNTREAIYAALFGAVGLAAGFNTKGRRYIPWSEIAPELQPALFQVQRKEAPHQITNLPASWKLDVDLIIYVNTAGDLTIAPSTLLNPILDAVTSLFDAGVPGNKQTLGGLVHIARISGTIETDEGVLGDQAFALVPIEIITY